MGVYIWSNNPRLPAEYQEVEYIQNNGNLYINSGYAPNQDTKAELKFSNWTEVGSYDVFGTDRGFANSGFTLLSTVPCYGNQTVGVSKNVADGNLHIITLGKDGYVVDGELITTFNTQTFTSLNLYLFALNRNGSAREYAHYRFYYMKIWNNGTLVRDFIPCYRKSDDVIGLYDLVNSQFYTKSGSGTFTKGSDVIEKELKNAYIGEYHEVICDFTQGDQGFNLDEVHGGATSGRDGNGFYIKSGYSWGAGARLLIPSTITSVGTPKMIKLYGKNMNVGAGVGISEGIDSKCIRAFGSQISCSPYSGTGAWGTPNNTNVSPLNEDVFVIDFENGICYLESSPNITATIYPSTILTLWNNGTLNLCLLSPNSNYYGYLQKAEFYF